MPNIFKKQYIDAKDITLQSLTNEAFLKSLKYKSFKFNDRTGKYEAKPSFSRFLKEVGNPILNSL